MKSSKPVRDQSSLWITCTGIALAILICLLCAVLFVFYSSQPNSFTEFVLMQATDFFSLPAENSFGFFPDTQPTPFQPSPVKEPTPAPESPSSSSQVEANSSNEQTPVSASVNGLRGSPQLYTLDCEFQAAVDWARFFGHSLNELELIERIPKSDDPESGFVGEINGPMGKFPPDSYGVHAAPIARLLQEYGLPAKAKHNWDLSGLKKEIASGQPVIVWIVNMPFEIETMQYTASNGNTSTVARFEHTWIVTGYNASSITVIDSAWTYNVSTSAFIERWGALGNQAIVYTE